jgi:hypothetical protein
MPAARIISNGQARTILRKTLCKAALEKRATELAGATEEERQKITKEIDEAVDSAMQEHAIKYGRPFIAL